MKRVKMNQIKMIQMTKREQKSIIFPSTTPLMKSYKIKDVDEMFSFSVSKEIDHKSDDLDPMSIC